MLSRRASSAVEFAIIAPVLLTLVIGVFDLARACIVWEQTCSAAEAVAEAAEKLSVSPGSTLSALTATQMQAAMSTVYAQVPGLSLGNGSSSTGSTFFVTLSSVIYTPTCVTSSGCAAQLPYVAWSTYLSRPGVVVANPPLRRCGALTKVVSFPDDSTQLTKMPYWSQNRIVLTPQVVADVQTMFVPTFGWFTGPITFWSSATMPTPLGGTDQAFTYNTAGPAGSVEVCTVPG